MSGIVVIRYPRLYTSVHAGPTSVIQSKGDLAVNLLYETLVDRRYNHNRFAFQAQVIDVALRLFGDFSVWIDAQMHNPQIVGHNRAFLEDTLKFIAGSDRELRIENWIELVSSDEANIHLADLRVPQIAPRLQQSPSTVVAIQKWCSRPEGLEDLLGTMYLLFGRAP